MFQSGRYPFIVRMNRVDCITLSSVVTTGIAIACALEQRIQLAMALLFIAMTADALDGALARRWGISSHFGRYLDGFMDVLIYLVGPSLVAYQSGFNGFWGLSLLLMVGAGCVRLSVFNQTGNVESGGALRYMGMPVFWSLFIFAGYILALDSVPAIYCRIALAAMLAIFAVLMVVDKPFFKFRSIWKMLSLTLGGALLFLLREPGVQAFELPLLEVALLQIPIVFGGVLHMVLVTRNGWQVLNKPLHRGWFGANKTWRGVVAMPLFSAIGAVILAGFAGSMVLPHWLSELGLFGWLTLGALVGFAYILAELPNSFVKRRMGAVPGTLPQRYRLLFVAFDQLDSTLGIALTLCLAGFSGLHALLFLVMFPITALVVKRLLFLLQLKKTAT